jgi:hypothetical protein
MFFYQKRNSKKLIFFIEIAKKNRLTVSSRIPITPERLKLRI